MKLKVQISIDIDAEDYIAAAEHQRRTERLLERIRADYAQARLSFSPVRGRAPLRADDGRLGRRATGNLAAYADL